MKEKKIYIQLRKGRLVFNPITNNDHFAGLKRSWCTNCILWIPTVAVCCRNRRIIYVAILQPESAFIPSWMPIEISHLVVVQFALHLVDFEDWHVTQWFLESVSKNLKINFANIEQKITPSATRNRNSFAYQG